MIRCCWSSLLGVIAMVARRTSVGPDAIVAASHALPYLLVFGLYFGTKARYLVTLLPYLACLAAFGTRGIVRFAALRLGEVAYMVSEFSPLRTVGGRAQPLLAR